MAEREKMCIMYELNKGGIKELFVKKGIYKHPSDAWIDLFFDPLELTEQEREILFEECECGVYCNELIYEKLSLPYMNDIHELIDTIKNDN